MPTIVIIGASSGIGRAVARTYASRGWKVGVCARRAEALQELHREFPENIVWKILDVTMTHSGESLSDFLNQIGGADVILLAAGCGWNNPSLKTSEDERTVSTNVDGFTRIATAAFNWFALNSPPDFQKGQLCAITSIAGTKGIGISATYSASKRYQTTFLQALSQLAVTRHIKIDITDIRPGFIDTALLDSSSHSYPLLMNVPYAVKRIIKAIDKKKKIAYIDWRWRIIVQIWETIPSWLWRHIKLLS